MGAISRINKYPLNQRTKTQLRNVLRNASRVSFLSADTTNHADSITVKEGSWLRVDEIAV